MVKREIGKKEAGIKAGREKPSGQWEGAVAFRKRGSHGHKSKVLQGQMKSPG